MPAGIDLHYNRYRVRKSVDGQRIARTFASLAEAEAFLHSLEADAADRARTEHIRVTGVATIGDVVDTWWLGPLIDGERTGGHRRRVSLRTARDYEQYIERYLRTIWTESAQSFARNPSLLKLFYDSLPNRMAWHVHGLLRMAFREAVARGVIDRNPCELEKPAKRKRTRRLIPDREQVATILSAAWAEDSTWGLFVHITATLGTRCGETCALRWEDFDRSREVVHIERAVSKTAGRPILKEPKKGEPRTLWVSPAFFDVIEPLRQEKGFLFEGFYRNERRGAPKPWHPDHAAKRFRTMVRRLGLPQYTLHALRHFVATQLLIEQQPVNQVAEFLGHTPAMTLMLYGRHLDEDAMRRVGVAATRITSGNRAQPHSVP